jgi:hypothetical protein
MKAWPIGPRVKIRMQGLGRGSRIGLGTGAGSLAGFELAIEEKDQGAPAAVAARSAEEW